MLAEPQEMEEKVAASPWPSAAANGSPAADDDPQPAFPSLPRLRTASTPNGQHSISIAQPASTPSFNTAAAGVNDRSRRNSAYTAAGNADMNCALNIEQTARSHEQERAASIAHDVCCHQLPSLCSPRPIRRVFARKLDSVIRATIAFLIAGIIAVQPWAADVLAIPYLFAMFTAGTVRPTVGSTLSNIDSQGKGVLTAAVVDIVVIGVQVPALSSTSRIIAVELLLFVTSIGLAYYYTAPLARRFSLACHGLTMILISNGGHPVYLPFQIALCFFLSYGISFFLVLLPFPRLAGDELLDRYQRALVGLSQVFGELLAAYLETERVAPLVLQTAAVAELDSVFRSLSVMRRLQQEMAMESHLFLWTFPASISIGCPVLPDVDNLERLYWITTNLLQALSTQHYSSYHTAFVQFLREPYLAFAAAQSDFLSLLGSERAADITKQRVDSGRKRLAECAQQSWRQYTQARTAVYGLDSRLRSHPAHPHRHYDVDDEVRVDVENDATPHSLLTSGPVATRLRHTTADVLQRSSVLFYLTRFHETLQSLPVDFSLHEELSQRAGPAVVVSHRQVRHYSIAQSVRHHFQHPLSWSLVGFHPLKDLWSLCLSFALFLRHPSVDLGWLKSSVKVSLCLCLSSLIAVLPFLNTSDVFPNALWATFTAAVVTSDNEGALWERSIHRIFGTLVGGLIGYLILYAFPTSHVGAIAFLTFWSVPALFVQESSYAYLGALAQYTPIVIVLGYQTAGASLSISQYALARMEEILIGVAIVLVVSSLLWPVSSIRLLRSEIILSAESFMLGIGKTASIYERAALRQERMQQQQMRDIAAAAGKASPSQSEAERRQQEDNAAMADAALDAESEDALLQSLLSSSSSVQMSLSRQARLLSEAVNEPVLIFNSFPSSAYRHIANTQRRIWCLLLTIEPALELILRYQQRRIVTARTPSAAAAVSGCPLTVKEEMFDLAAMRGEVRVLTAEALSLLSGCVSALQSGRPAQLRDGVTTVVREVRSLEKKFATNLNDIARRAREGRGVMLSSEAIVPIAVFLFAVVELSEQLLLLDAGVRRLLELEQPAAYED